MDWSLKTRRIGILVCLLIFGTKCTLGRGRGDVGRFGSSEESDETDSGSLPVRSPLELRHCPSDITVTMEPCERSDVIEISWDEPIAASDTSDVTLISQNVQSGSVFHSGETTTVEYIFEDEFGQRVNCTFSVSVLRAASMCFVTHGPHIVSFDGFQYGFRSDCMYTLVSRCGETELPEFKLMGDFLSQSLDEDRFALREVRLFYKNNEFILRQGKTVLLNGVRITYPLVDFHGVSIYWNNPNNILTTDFGLSVKFDGEKNAEIFLATSQPVCGLCGTNDFDPLNDQHLSNGQQANTVTDFVDAWASVVCDASGALAKECRDNSTEKEVGLEQCGAFYDEKVGPFGNCYKHVNEVPLYDSCVENVCSFPLDTSLPCDYYEHFAQICGVAEVLATDWREGIPPHCEMECPAGMTLSTCVSACPPTCAEPNGPEECDMPCIEACVCPEGQLLDGTTCVAPEDCGCLLHTGEYISLFEEWTSPDCTTRCYCEGRGELQCRNYTCNENADCTTTRAGVRTCQCHEGLNGNGEICVAEYGYCQIWGDPHYLTFDGKQYDFQGGCQYTLVKKCKGRALPDFHLIGDNKRRNKGDRVSYQREIKLRYRGHEYYVRRNYVSVDGVRITLPLLNHAGVTIHYDVPFTTVQTEFGLKFRYNQRTDSEVYLSNNFASKVCGLCGNFDGNRRNELTKPNGKRSGRPRVFAQSWIVPGDPECPEDVEDFEPTEDDLDYESDPCLFADSSQISEAETLCQILSPDDDRLASCHRMTDSQMYYDTCKYDLCATLPDQTALCDSIEEFLTSCREAGGDPGDWRSGVPQCPFNCPAGFEYSHCGSGCPDTCMERNRSASCENNCQETCLCPEGQVLDGNRCVFERDCGCLLENGRYISRGETWTSNNCTELCTCEGGHLECNYVYCDENAQCVIENGERKCRCDEGFVSLGQKCIQETGICLVWGRTHFLTYDGISHDWRGNCVYSFIKTCGPLPHGLKEFHLTGDFDPLTVTKRIFGLKRVRLHYDGHEYRIEENRVLLDGLEVTLPLHHNGVFIYLRPIFTVLEADFGLRVLYNQNANFRMHLVSDYGGSVCGLCGNFDGIEDNDFTTPDGSLTSDLYEFGNSWAVEDCAVVTESPNPCAEDQELHQEALDMCSALNNDEFSVCRGPADFSAFYDACVDDLCSSELSDEQLCASMEAYIAICGESASIPSNWRENVPECAFNCPEGMVYTTCGSGCPPTCMDPYGQANCTESCTETCTCPDGQVLDGGTCVPMEACGCVMQSGFYLSNGQTQVNEDCSQICSCRDRALTCHEYSCHDNAECDLRDGLQECWCVEGFIGDGNYCRPATSVCRIWGDPHYITFDGRSHDFQGGCEYSLVETMDSHHDLPEFKLYVDNVRKSRDSKGTFLRQLRLLYGGNEFVLKRRGGGVRLNGQKITLPLYDYHGITIFFSYPNIILETDFGLSLTYNRKSKVDVTLSAEYGGQIGGLCGDFDENKRNDLKLPDGTLTRSVNKFGNSWDVNEKTCTPEEGEDPPSPCKEDPAMMAQAERLCSALSPQSDIFADCRGSNMDVFFDACTYDLCSTNLNTSYICESAEEYASACEDAGGSPGDWQAALPECVDDCPLGMLYTDCGPPCPDTCADDQQNKRNCSLDGCIKTCVCPVGQVLDGLECKPSEECGCNLPDGIYIPNESTHISETCDQFCNCMGGELSCFSYLCDSNANCTVEGGIRRCRCNEGFIGSGETCRKGPGEGKALKPDPITIGNCPTDMNKTLPICEGGAMMNWETPTAVSNEGLAVALVIQTQQPGTFFEPGVYDVLYQFEDENFNNAECSFTIAVTSGLQIPEGHCATPEGNILESGSSYMCSDCTEECSCFDGVLVCREVSCSQFATCTVQHGERGCYCLDGFHGDGISCNRVGCPQSFYSFGSSCYYFSNGPRMSFNDARSFCQGMGADLPVIETQAENDYLGEMNGENQRSWLLARRHEDNDYILERTGPSLEYKFLADPLPSGFNAVQFSVKASEEVHILLSSTKDTSGPAYEIVFGANSNTRSYIALCPGCEREVNFRNDDLLSSAEHRHFFITITGRTIHIGKIVEGYAQYALYIYVNRSPDGPIDVNYIGFGTKGVRGEWAFYKTSSWLNGADWTFENWHGSKPEDDPMKTSCIQLGYGCPSHWVDVQCTELLKVICEM